MKGDGKKKTIEWRRHGDCIRCLSHYHDNEGYPFLTRGGHRMKMARHIMFRKFGEQPSSIVTRHTCDNGWCINPDHIIKGTQNQNREEQTERHRNPKGNRHWNWQGGHSRSTIWRRAKETMRTLE